jgi:hypothetical protein
MYHLPKSRNSREESSSDGIIKPQKLSKAYRGQTYEQAFQGLFTAGTSASNSWKTREKVGS